jgi:hypothetical protein
MIRLFNVCTLPLTFFCVLTLSTLAEAQFETRSTTLLAHPVCGIATGDFNKDGKQDAAWPWRAMRSKWPWETATGPSSPPFPTWLATG